LEQEAIGTMRIATQTCLALITLFAAARVGASADQPSPLVPVRPFTREEVRQREARELYGLGLLRQREDRLVEATRIFEEALQLDPQAAPLYKALIPLYLALGRTDDAFALFRKTLDLDPGDHATWALYARQLKSQGRPKEACAALQRGLGCRSLADRPDIRAQLYYELGALRAAAQEYDAALAAFSEVVKILDNPLPLLELGSLGRDELAEQAAGVYERIVRLCIDAGQHDRALQLFAQGQKNYPGLARRLNYNLAKVYAAHGQPAMALERLDEFLRTQPRGAEAYELRLTILHRLGRDAEAVPSLEHYAAGDAHNVALQLLLARQYGATGQAREAERLYQKLLAGTPTPEVYRALFGLYRDHRELGGMSRALELLDDSIGRAEKKETRGANDAQAAAEARAMLAALRDDPELAGTLFATGLQALEGGAELHYQTRYFLAVVAARARHLDEAERLYRRCLEEGTRRQQESAVYGGLLQVLWQARKYEAIAEVCRRGLAESRATNHVLFHHNLSRALAALGKMEEAVAEADKAVELAGDDNRLLVRLNRMTILGRAERYREAVALGEQLLKEFTRPGEVRDVRSTLSNVYSLMRDFTRAEEQLRLILKEDPNDATANNDLGYLWADQGKNLEEAERLIRKALDLDVQQRKTGSPVVVEDEGENAAYLDSLGWVLFRRGQAQAARGWLEKAAALKAGAEDPTVWDHLGDVYFRLEEPARALAAWQKAVGLYETDGRRKADDHYRELRHKLRLLESPMRQP
jgi:tetratricopeptide (TPR) repeat protein